MGRTSPTIRVPRDTMGGTGGATGPHTWCGSPPSRRPPATRGRRSLAWLRKRLRGYQHEPLPCSGRGRAGAPGRARAPFVPPASSGGERAAAPLPAAGVPLVHARPAPLLGRRAAGHDHHAPCTISGCPAGEVVADRSPGGGLRTMCRSRRRYLPEPQEDQRGACRRHLAGCRRRMTCCGYVLKGVISLFVSICLLWSPSVSFCVSLSLVLSVTLPLSLPHGSLSVPRTFIAGHA